MIRMSTWAKIRHMHSILEVPKKQIARRLGVDVKTVRRTISASAAPQKRASPPRGRRLDEHREEVLELLSSEPKISAKRIARILEPKTGRLGGRTVRRYVRELRGLVRKPEVFVHRTHAPGKMMEVDFGESWAKLGGHRTKVHFIVVTLPASNVYFAKAYLFERAECLMDGIASALVWFGGLPGRAVLDNTSIAVKKILKGEERVESKLFAGFRGEWPLHIDYCNPASGWEKGSVEKGVDYVRGLAFRPMPQAKDIDELNEFLLNELDLDLDRRSLPCGKSVREAFEEERKQLAPLPAYLPDTARALPCVADKYGLVYVDRASYSVPSEYARRSVVARLYHDRIEISADGEVIATHKRSARTGENVIELEHVIDVLERKPRAAMEATAIRQLGLPDAFYRLRVALREQRRKSDKEWVQVIRLLLEHTLDDLHDAVEAALESNAPGLSTIKQLLRFSTSSVPVAEPVDLTGYGVADMTIAEPDLSDWDVMCAGGVL